MKSVAVTAVLCAALFIRNAAPSCYPTPQCVSRDPCERSNCSTGQQCNVQLAGGQLKAACAADCTCKDRSECHEVHSCGNTCSPRTTCLAIEDVKCAVMRCRAGFTCMLLEVQCIRAPCPPVGECVPDCYNVKCEGQSKCVMVHRECGAPTTTTTTTTTTMATTMKPIKCGTCPNGQVCEKNVGSCATKVCPPDWKCVSSCMVIRCTSRTSCQRYVPRCPAGQPCFAQYGCK